MIATNPHLPPDLARFLAGTTANAAQVVQYLQPDPTTDGKRRLLRELTPMMGPAVQVARDWVVAEGCPVHKRAGMRILEKSRIRNEWAYLIAEDLFMGQIRTHLRRVRDNRDNESAVIRCAIQGLKALDAGNIETVSAVGEAGDYVWFACDWLDWVKPSHIAAHKGTEYKKMFYGSCKAVYPLIALDTWIASTPFGGGA